MIEATISRSLVVVLCCVLTEMLPAIPLSRELDLLGTFELIEYQSDPVDRSGVSYSPGQLVTGHVPLDLKVDLSRILLPSSPTDFSHLHVKKNTTFMRMFISMVCLQLLISPNSQSRNTCVWCVFCQSSSTISLMILFSSSIFSSSLLYIVLSSL